MTKTEASAAWTEAGQNLRDIQAWTAERIVLEAIDGLEFTDDERQHAEEIRDSWAQRAAVVLQVFGALHEAEQCRLFEDVAMLDEWVIVRRRWWHNLSDRIWRWRAAVSRWVVAVVSRWT